MQEPRFKRILKKYYKEEASDAEQYFVDCWYESFSLPQDQQPVLYKGGAEAVRQRILNKIIPPVISLKWYKRRNVQLAAAMLAGVAIVAPFLFNYLKPAPHHGMAAFTLQTGKMQIKKIVLADSSVIWLNANSSMTVAEGFGDINRDIQLDGEAFFDVHQQSQQPFVIATDSVRVKVLGTSFNVSSYHGLANIRVAVNTGKVQVSDHHRNLAVLTQGQGITYDKTNQQFKVEEVHADMSNAWTAGRIVLEKASFEELAQAVHNLYGTTLTSEDKRVQSFKYNLTLRKGQSEKEVMDLVATMLKKNHKKEGDHVIIY